MRILAINPGSTSTKIAVYDESDALLEKNITHHYDQISSYESVMGQIEFRYEILERTLTDNNISIQELTAVVGRGGFMKPISSGVYRINHTMLQDLSDKSLWGREHSSNLGAFLAKRIAETAGIPSFVVDPVTVDEMVDHARISGLPGIERRSLFHALNIRACARRAASSLKKNPDHCDFVIAHLGGGISVVAYHKGKCIDVNNALLGMGPFSLQRAGALPIGDLVELAYSGKYTKDELLNILAKESGLYGYLGTDNGLEIEAMIKSGDKKACAIVKAMAYQIVKEIGAMATALHGRVDAIILTGGLAHMQTLLVPFIQNNTSFLAPCIVYPGENELQSMIEGVLMVLKNIIRPKDYQ